MRRFWIIALVLIALPVLAQTISYFNQGFLRQPDAQSDRAYLGLAGVSNVVANFFTTNNVTPQSLTNGFIDAVYGNANYYPLVGNPSGFLTANQPITLTGDVTGGPSSTSIATTLKNTGTAGTYTKTTFNAKGLETSGASAVLASADFANQGTATTVLHGNAAGNPSWGSVNLGTDTAGLLPSAGWQGSTNVWNLNGNTLGQTNSFLGTVDNIPLKFRVNNVSAILLNTNNSVAIVPGATTALAPNSVALGFNASATNSTAVAIGNASKASGVASTAIGSQSIASATRAIAIGPTTASGVTAVSFGQGNLSSGENSVTMGNNSCQAIGKGSFAFGDAAFSGFDGSFVWSDNQELGNSDTAPNQFVVTAGGGIFFTTGGTAGSGLTVDFYENYRAGSVAVPALATSKVITFTSAMTGVPSPTITAGFSLGTISMYVDTITVNGFTVRFTGAVVGGGNLYYNAVLYQ